MIRKKNTARSQRGKRVRKRVVAAAAIPGNWHRFLRVDENKMNLFAFLTQIALEWFDEKDKQLVITDGEGVHSKAQKCVGVFVDLYIYNRMAKIVLADIDLLFEGQKFRILISLKRWELAQNSSNDFCRCGYLLTNDTVTKITPNDFDQLFLTKTI